MSSFVQHRLLADPVRVAILRALGATDRPLGVRELADAVGRHPNSVREQLERLVDGGLVARIVESPGRRGRPPHRYRLTDTGLAVAEPAIREHGPAGSQPVRSGHAGAPTDASVTADSTDEAAYAELARILADALSRLGGIASAEAAGEAWGSALVGRAARRTHARRAVRRLVAILDRVGFAPETTTRPDAPVRLRRCPFLALARERRDVVCSVHLGMLRGVLRTLAAPLEAVALEPFVQPDLCLVRLAPISGPRGTGAALGTAGRSHHAGASRG
jgi:predicted ArsR family transcriptional regulator